MLAHSLQNCHSKQSISQEVIPPDSNVKASILNRI